MYPEVTRYQQGLIELALAVSIVLECLQSQMSQPTVHVQCHVSCDDYNISLYNLYFDKYYGPEECRLAEGQCIRIQRWSMFHTLGQWTIATMYNIMHTGRNSHKHQPPIQKY